MKSFKTYLAESSLDRHSSVEQIHSFLKDATKNGEITKKDWDDTKYLLSKLIKKDWDSNVRPIAYKWTNSIFSVKKPGGGYEDPPSWFDNDVFVKSSFGKLVYKSVSYPTDVPSVKKLIDGAKKESSKRPKYFSNDLIKAAETFYKTFSEVSEMLINLKPKVVTVSQVRAVKKEEKRKTIATMRSNAQVMVDALMSQIEDAKKMAKQNAEEHVDNIWKELAKKNWDVIDDMKAAKALSRQVIDKYMMLTDVDPKSVEKNKEAGDHFKFSSRFRIKSEARKKMYVDEAVTQAEEDYKEYVGKMVSKVGSGVADAHVTGHPWTNSVLTVTMTDGTKEVWHTQMIINYSKYGKPFYQFPSRRKK